jgi:hypothetical protein
MVSKRHCSIFVGYERQRCTFPPKGKEAFDCVLSGTEVRDSLFGLLVGRSKSVPYHFFDQRGWMPSWCKSLFREIQGSSY